VARLFGISRRQVQNLAEDGVIPKQGQFNTAHYVWDEVRDAYLRHKLAQIKGLSKASPWPVMGEKGITVV